MLDFHTHSLLSDGELLPGELIRRGVVAGYSVIAVTDHADISNLDFVLPRILRASQDACLYYGIQAIPGVELTHVPPSRILDLTNQARQLGARLVLVHGETIAEPVAEGTNRAALAAQVDILAHPGLISLEEAELAAKHGIYLEISCRRGHSLTNGHVARMAQEAGAKLILGTDAHCPGDLVSVAQAEKILRGAGLDQAGISAVWDNARNLARKCLASSL